LLLGTRSTCTPIALLIMSRKSGQDQSAWQMPSIYAFVGEYGPFKAKEFDPIEDTLIWLCNTATNDDDEMTRRHAMYPLAAPIQAMLVRQAESRFTTVLVVDLCDVFESLDEYYEALAKEEETVELTKALGKKLIRLFQKLLLHRVAMAAEGELCPLLLKVYKALERIDATYKLEENNTISELWLLQPELSTKYVNTQCVVEEGARHREYPVQLNLVYPSEATNKVSVLKAFFVNLGTEIVADGPINNWCFLVAQRKDAKRTPKEYDSEFCNDLGKMLFASEMKVEMNRYSKQYERKCTEMTPVLLAILEPDEDDGDGDAAGSIDWSTCEHHVGGLLLRGNRCVLARSIYHEWEGMRIPSVVPYPEETPHEAAIRAVEEFTEVDPCELRPLPHVLPVALYAPNGRPLRVDLYPLYANSPPPDEVGDEEDEEDPYDWYTFAGAVARLDPASVSGLQTLSLALRQASRVGLVPSQWGGIFGQEWQDSTNGFPGVAE